MILTSTFTTALKFVAHAAAKKDIRNYLMGVLFEFKNGRLTLVATNGASVAFAAMDLNPAPTYDLSVIIDNETVKQILKAFAGKKQSAVDFVITLAQGKDKPTMLTLDSAGIQITPKPIDGHYPDWRRVIPDPARTNSPCPFIDVALLGAACVAMEPLVQSRPAQAITINVGSDKPTFIAIRPANIADPLITDCGVVIGSIRD